MPVSKRLRYEILRRDNHTCRYCGATADDTRMTVDHVVPVALGGCDKPSNLVAACMDCNAGKSSTPADAPLIADVAGDDMRWAQAMRKAAEIDRQKRTDDRLFVNEFIDKMSEAMQSDPEERVYCFPDMTSPDIGGAHGFLRSVTQFRDCGLDMEDLMSAMLKAARNPAIDDRHNWKYFCGICWRMIEGRQDAARALIEAEDAD